MTVRGSLCDFRGKSILVVDSFERSLLPFEPLLIDLNAKIFYLENFSVAFELLKREKFDGIIVDAPRSKEVFARFMEEKALSLNASTPTLVMTESEPFMLDEQFFFRVTCWLPKPCDEIHFLSLANQHFVVPYKNSRRHPRAKVNWPVYFSLNSTSNKRNGRILNCSKTGIFIGTALSSECMPGEYVKFHFHSENPNDQKLYTGEGTIQWVSEWQQSGLPNGIGIKLEMASSDFIRKISKAS